MKKIGVVGHFGGDKVFFDGQTVKTKNLYRALAERYDESSLQKLDTYGYKKNIISFFFRTIKFIFTSKNIVMLPDENGVRVFVPIYCFLNAFLKRGLHYAVVGGWLPVFLKKHKVVGWFAKRLTGVYVETESMKTALEEMGFKNVYILKNFKYLNALSERELEYNTNLPLRLCVFSRIMEQKGVEEAVSAVESINASAGKTVYQLDLYGPIDVDYQTRFDKLQKTFSNAVRYCGAIPSDKSVETMKDYFALLFPTKFYTEGIPGTLIDALAAGVPVITSRWVNCADIFKEGVTGWGFDFGDFREFKRLLEKAASDPSGFLKMKQSALEEMKNFTPEEVSKALIQRIL